ncbi:LexA family protein [Biostraticola tofi]|uniref:Peptidase S24-like protein n=1 Tax=Biostraticola tofi TaxID=466109 RepID=A0A4R3Z7C2_9GAMM|nr:XRE family transcriptional regulator [Biostraticola tofi]TCW00425.1 peptidase S24-like protein [Biostraticola tofi]
MENKEIRKMNLENLINEYQAKGLNKAQFAEACGTSASTLSQVIGNNPTRNVGDKMARKIELMLNLGSGWMDKAHSPQEAGNVTYAGPYKPGKRYPVLSAVSAGAWSEANEPYSIEDVGEWQESDAKIQGTGFWLVVEGDSMTAPTGVSIPENSLVLFDTGREPVNGSLVIAKMVDANEATFKKFIIDGGQRYLKGLNPAWPLVPINGNCKIIGVAIETRMKLV